MKKEKVAEKQKKRYQAPAFEAKNPLDHVKYSYYYYFTYYRYYYY